MTINLLLAQFSSLIGLFLSMVLFTWLPLKLLRKKQLSAENLPMRYENAISLANCLSGGVFLATFFVGLLPEVRLEMQNFLRESNIETSLPLTEVVVIFGFFLAVFVEQFALTVKEAKNQSNTEEYRNGAVKAANSVNVRDQFPLDDDMLDTSLLTDNISQPSSSTALLFQIHDSDDVVTGPSTPLSPASRPRDASAPSNDRHGHGSNHSYGHSHHHHDHGHSHQHHDNGHSHQHQHHDHGHSHNHGHGHSHDVEALLQPSSSLRFGILLMSLGVHSLFEGMALGLQNEVHTLLNLFIGVWIHECLIAFALGFSMVKLQVSNCRLWQISILFSSMIPFGQLIGIALGSSESWTSQVWSTFLQAIAAGTFIQVTFFEIIPEGLGVLQNKCRMLKVFLLFFGFTSIAAITFLVQFQG